MSESHRIDVHHHIAPPAYIAELAPKNMLNPVISGWTLAKSIEDMDKAGVTTSITTVTTPGFWFGDVDQTRRLVRACNEYAEKLVQDHPDRFGMFAALPLPDVEGSLREDRIYFGPGGVEQAEGPTPFPVGVGALALAHLAKQLISGNAGLR